LLSSGADAWIETGKLEGELRYDEGSDHHGPLDIALRLTRNRTAAADAPKQGPESTIPNTDEQAQKSERPPPEQRVVVFGDGDFLSNSYLGNSGNLDLGLKTVNWLTSDETLIEVPAGRAIDRRLDLSDTQAALISTGFLMLLPAVLGGMGFWVWLRRRRA
jgi:ABC-type uncharacterized transport system involved in gliding motility auxiliary subunit